MRMGIGKGLVMIGLLLPLVRAEAVTVEQILQFRPTQEAGLTFDTPAQSVWESCKIEVLKSGVSGWVLRDDRGLVVRRFVDSNGDNVVDQWSYFHNGQEVYRDIDTNANKVADQVRYFHTGGSRWGIDRNEDGVIDGWQRISAEEATQEAVAAIATRDMPRLRRVLVTAEDLKSLGVGSAAVERVMERQADIAGRFQALTRSVSTSTTWSNFDGQLPAAVPASDIGGESDLIVYRIGTIIAESDSENQWFRVPELVRAGDVWKLTDLPDPIKPGTPIADTGLLVEMPQPQLVSSGGGPQMDLPEAALEYVKQLQEHDTKNLPTGPNADPRAAIQYHVKRAELCAYIGSKCEKLDQREHWYRQTADSLHAATQTGQYRDGLSTLSQYAEQFAKTSWGKGLAGYFDYRAINAEYALALASEKDHAKAQDAYLEKLKGFVEKYPQTEDLPEALWQLGNGMEFTDDSEKAIAYYEKLVAGTPKSPLARKAEGALRRLDLEGKTVPISGDALNYRGTIELSRYRGKIVAVTYWATWCEPCKQQLAKLQELRKKYERDGFEVIGVCLDSEKQEAYEFVKGLDYDFPHIFAEGGLDSPPANTLGIFSLPYTFLVGADGQVIQGNLELAELQGIVEKAMAQRLATRQK